MIQIAKTLPNVGVEVDLAVEELVSSFTGQVVELFQLLNAIVKLLLSTTSRRISCGGGGRGKSNCKKK
jgi:hypothetical protein